MLRVGVIGIDGHGRSFTSAFNGVPNGAPNIADAVVEWVWAPNQSDAHAFATELSVHKVAAEPTDMVGHIDLALVLHDSDGGASHVELAMPFLSAGIATFVDRPIATSFRDATRLFDVAEAHDAPLMTGSPLRFACEIDQVRLAVDRLGAPSSVFASGPGSWWFYAYHVLEMYYAIFGPGVSSVYRHADEARDVAVLSHRSGHSTVVQVLRDTPEQYMLTIFGSDGTTSQTFTDHWLHWKEAGPHAFRTRMMQAAADMARTRISPSSRDEVLEQLAVLRAGVLSAKSGTATSVDSLLARVATDSDNLAVVPRGMAPDHRAEQP